MQTSLEPTLTEQQGRALWRAMQSELEAGNLTAPSLVATLLKTAVLLPLFAGSLALSWSESGFWPTLAGYAGLALLLAQFAFIGHDAGHGSLSARPGVNRFAGQLSMTLITGLAFDEWKERHRAHHRFCQHEAQDPDMMVSLVVSLTERSSRGKGRVGRFFTRHQQIHIWLLSFLFGHSQRHLSQAAALAAPRRYAIDSFMLLPHFGLWLGLPCVILDVPFQTALLAYVAPLTLLGPYLAAIFWVNHVGMPLIDRPERFSFFEHQYATSRTIVNPPACNWIFGGLNFQIEHHLFPQVPSGRLSTVQPIVKRHLARQGLVYHGMPWTAAVREVALHLRRIARVR